MENNLSSNCKIPIINSIYGKFNKENSDSEERESSKSNNYDIEEIKSKIYNNTNKMNTKINRNECFNFILKIIKKEKITRKPKENVLISYYLHYLNEFYDIIKKSYQDSTDEQLIKISNQLNYIYYPNNRVIFKFGEIGKSFYIILKGRINILVPKQKIELLSIKEYYRYLAILAGYEEKELINHTINANAEIYPLEIDDPIGYGRITTSLSVQARKKIKRIELKTLFSNLNEQEKKIIEEGKSISFEEDGNFKFLNENFDENEIENDLDSDYEDKRNKTMKIKSSKKINFQKRRKSLIFSEFLLNEPNNENDDGIDLSSQKYIDRIKVYKYENLPQNEKRENKFYIFEYSNIKTLKTGQKFGDFASYEMGNKRTATIITSSDSHFAILNKGDFLKYVKTAIDKNKKNYISYILTTFIFNDTNVGFLQDKLFNNFVINDIKKGEYALSINKKNDSIIFLKEGIFEIGMKLSLKEILIVIQYYIEKINNLISRKKFSWGLEIEEEIYKNFIEIASKMKEENHQVENFAKEIEEVELFYNQKFEMILWLSNINDMLGFDDLGYENNKNLFFIRCISDKAEYMTLDKDIYQKFYEIEYLIKRKEYEYVKMKLMRIIHRLIEIRQIKIKTFSEHNMTISNFINVEKEKRDFNEYFEKQNGEKASNLRKLPLKKTFNKINNLVLDIHLKRRNYNKMKTLIKTSRNILSVQDSKRNLSNSKDNTVSAYNEFINHIKIKKSHSTLFIRTFKNNRNNDQKTKPINCLKNSASTIDNITKDESSNLQDNIFKNSYSHIVFENEKLNKIQLFSKEININPIQLRNFSQKNIFYDKKNRQQFMLNRKSINSISKSLEIKNTFDRISNSINKKINLVNPISIRNIKKNNFINFRKNYNIKNTRDKFLRFRPTLNLTISKKKKIKKVFLCN